MNLEKSLNEIITREESFKERREFKKGQNLYTEWLNLALGDENASLEASSTIGIGERDKMKENIAVAFNNRGQLKYLEVDFDGAVEDYNKALKFSPLLSSAYYNRATIMYRMGYFEKAVKDMTEATKLSPTCEEFQLALERCKLELTKQ